MIRRVFTTVGIATLTLFVVEWVAAPRLLKAVEQPARDEELTISTIMMKAHLRPQNRATRNNLDNKVLDNKATEDEKKELLRLYTALGKQTPPRGKAEDWKKRTDDLVESLKAVCTGEKDAKERFLRAKDCKACHAAHRGCE